MDHILIPCQSASDQVVEPGTLIWWVKITLGDLYLSYHTPLEAETSWGRQPVILYRSGGMKANGDWVKSERSGSGFCSQVLFDIWDGYYWDFHLYWINNVSWIFYSYSILVPDSVQWWGWSWKCKFWRKPMPNSPCRIWCMIICHCGAAYPLDQ